MADHASVVGRPHLAHRLGQLVDVAGTAKADKNALTWDAVTGRWKAATIATAGIADGAVTDAKVGNRTISDVSAPTGDMGTLTTLLGWLANMLKAITGKANWRTAPAISLETLNLHATRHASVGADPVTPAAIGAATSGHNHDAAYVNVTGDTMTGDLIVYRAGAPTTGVVYLNQAQTRYLYFDGTNYQLPSSGLLLNGGTAWHSGNDGAASGLDADLLDGVQGAGYAASGHAHASTYLRARSGSYTGDGVLNRNISFGVTVASPYLFIITESAGTMWILNAVHDNGMGLIPGAGPSGDEAFQIGGHLQIQSSSFDLATGGDAGLGANFSGSAYNWFLLYAE